LFASFSFQKTSLKQIQLQYKNILNSNKPFPNISDVGFRIYSQVDEDGIIHFIFSIIGECNKQFVEIGTGNALECNCANLAINSGWGGLFIDCDKNAIEFGRIFYSLHPDTKSYPPKFLCTKVTKENINVLISNAGFGGEIDLLSIDIDGMDYWVLENITVVNPRVVIVEINPIFGLNSITVPYNPEYVRQNNDYYGASLPAFTKLLNNKGYRLIGTNRYGFNAFFLRNDIASGFFPSVSVESCRTHPRFKEQYYQNGFKEIAHMLYIKI